MNFKIVQRITLSLALIFTWHFAQSQCSATLNGGGFYCAEETATLTIELTGDGPWDVEWTLDGVPQAPLNITSSPFENDVPSPGGLFELTSVSSPTCSSGTVSGVADFVFSEAIVIGCDGQSISTCEPIFVICDVYGGSPPYLYEWSNGSTEPGPIILVSGTYEVTVTDVMGCSNVAALTVEVAELPCNVTTSGELSCLNPSVLLQVGCSFNPILLYEWTDGSGTIISNLPTVFVTLPDIYTVIVTDLGNGCVFTEQVEVVAGSEECAAISGEIREDNNDDCLFDTGEDALKGWMVKAIDTATGDAFFGFTDTSGNYNISVLPGDYVLDVVLPFPGLWAPCEVAVAVTLDSPDDSEIVDFHLGKLVDCPGMYVDLGTPFLRRCFNNTFNVQYCNYGTQPGEDAYVELTLDPLIELQDASIPWSGPVGNTYTFELGDVEVGNCGSFSVATYVSCDAELGQTLCAEAHIFPDTTCTPNDPAWSGASIELSSVCFGDSIIFTIANIGLGDMTEPLVYIVIEDGVMMFEVLDGPPLESGEFITFSLPANGSTYILQSPQVPNHPGNSNPTLAIEGCGTNSSGTFSLGFVNQFPLDDGNPTVSIDCNEIIGSWDPNDKTGYPLGFGEEHFIELGQDLEYRIRFQNTGTDTAFNVRITDVISDKLDISTIRPGASSHPYEMEILGSDTLVFLFPNIMLADSNVNEPLSHGFVKFKIEQAAGNELGDKIENTADIFFDFNEAVTTNTYLHLIGDHFVLSPTFAAQAPDIEVLVHPNPASGEITFHLSGDLPQGEITLSIFNVTGQLVQVTSAISPIEKVDLSNLSGGLYFYQLSAQEGLIGQGKLVVE